MPSYRGVDETRSAGGSVRLGESRAVPAFMSWIYSVASSSDAWHNSHARRCSSRGGIFFSLKRPKTYSSQVTSVGWEWKTRLVSKESPKALRLSLGRKLVHSLSGTNLRKFSGKLREGSVEPAFSCRAPQS